jgi:hypothetical protein
MCTYIYDVYRSFIFNLHIFTVKMFSWFPNMEDTENDETETVDQYLKTYGGNESYEHIIAASEAVKHEFSVILEGDNESPLPTHDTESETTVAGVHPVTRLKFGPKCRVNVPGYLRPSNSSTSTSSGFPSPRSGRVTSQTKLPWYPDDQESLSGRTREELASGGDSPSKLAHQRRLRSVYGPASASARDVSAPPVSRDPRDHTSSQVQLPLISTRSRARLQAGPFTSVPRPRGPPREPAPPPPTSYLDKWQRTLDSLERVYTADLDPDAQAGEVESRGASRGHSRASARDHLRDQPRTPTAGPAQLPSLGARSSRDSGRGQSVRIQRKTQAQAWLKRSMDAGSGSGGASFVEFDRQLDGDIMALERSCGIFSEIETRKV